MSGTLEGFPRAFEEGETVSQNVLYILREVAFSPRPCWEAFVSGDLCYQESCPVLPWLVLLGS